MASFWAYFAGGLWLRLQGCVAWLAVRLATTCLVMRRLVHRENASPDLDSMVRIQHAMAKVGVCVALEPHELGEGSSNERVMAVGCTVVGPVAVGCSWARYTSDFPVAQDSFAF